MKRNKMVFFIIGIGLIVIGAVFVTQQINARDVSQTSYNIEEGLENGDIIQEGNQIHNLLKLEEFYQNMNQNRDDSIKVVIYHSKNSSERYELFYKNQQLKVYSDIKIDALGRKEYKIKMYTGIKKILKNNQVIYKLVNDKEERQFLSYNLK